jgi:hypothetical protein
VTVGYRLVALNAQHGPVDSVVRQGRLRRPQESAVVGTRQPVELEAGEMGVHSTPLVTKDMVVVGSSMKEGMTVVTHNNAKGMVTAWDARTGRRI